MSAPSPTAFWLRFAASLPVAGAQGLWLKRTAPRMPARIESGATGRAGDGERALSLLVAGESPAVGVGCETMAQAVSVQLAERIAAKAGGAVDWQIIGRNGARSAEIAQLLITQRPRRVDPTRIAVVMLGVNDVTGLSSLRHWYEQLVAIRGHLRRRGFARIFLAPVPPMWRFTLLPHPLRGVLGDRARQLDAERFRVAALYPEVTALATEFPNDPELLAEDGYHPGPKACALWAEQLAEQMSGASVLDAQVGDDTARPRSRLVN